MQRLIANLAQAVELAFTDEELVAQLDPTLKATAKRLVTVRDEKPLLEQQRDSLEQQIDALDQQINSLKQQSASLKQQLHEREKLLKGNDDERKTLVHELKTKGIQWLTQYLPLFGGGGDDDAVQSLSPEPNHSNEQHRVSTTPDSDATEVEDENAQPLSPIRPSKPSSPLAHWPKSLPRLKRKSGEHDDNNNSNDYLGGSKPAPKRAKNNHLSTKAKTSSALPPRKVLSRSTTTTTAPSRSVATAPSYEGLSEDDFGFLEPTDIPTAGEVYLMQHKSPNAKPRQDPIMHTVLVLPTNDEGLARIGIDDTTFEATGLRRKNRQLPQCYMIQPDVKKGPITGFKDEYRDGGPRAHERQFPVLVLHDDMRIPAEGEFVLESNNSGFLECLWVEASKLAPFYVDEPDVEGSGEVRGVAAARDWVERVGNLKRKDGNLKGKARTCLNKVSYW